MADDKNGILKALRRFFSGEKTKKGEQIFNKWFHSFDDSKGYLDRLTREEREEYKQRRFLSLKKDLNIDNRPVIQPLFMKRPGKWAMYRRVAAIFMIGAVLSFAGVYLNSIFGPEELPVDMVQKANPIGQISGFTLPDGSRVWLSAASTLEYPETFSTSNRTVLLDGEAFFDVERDPDRPFVVISGPVSTRVLGTSFNIKAYTGDSGIEITLISGSLEVEADAGAEKHILAPSQQISYSKEAGLSKATGVDTSLINAWTRRELVFIRESFADIARTFERWYGVEFVFEDEALKEEVFVYHFRELSLSNSMIILSELADFEFEIVDGQTVVIRNANPEQENQ